jgi:hypothetical protein
MGLPSRGHANEQARDDLLGPAPGLGLAFAHWLATPLHLLVRQLVRFVRLIIDPLRQVITSSRVSSRIRAQGLSHHADRARGNLAAKRPGEPRRWQLPTPPRLSTHDDLHDVSRDLHDVSRDLHDVSRDLSRGRGTRHGPARCGWPAGQPQPNGKCEYTRPERLRRSGNRASIPVRRHTRPTAWLPRTKPKPKPVCRKTVQKEKVHPRDAQADAANRAPAGDAANVACRAKPPRLTNDG